MNGHFVNPSWLSSSLGRSERIMDLKKKSRSAVLGKKSKLLLGITGPKNRVHECYTNSYVDEINSLRFKYLDFHRGTGSLEKMQEDLFLFKCF